MYGHRNVQGRAFAADGTNAVPAAWSSGFPTIAPPGGTILSGPTWLGWDNALVMSVLERS